MASNDSGYFIQRTPALCYIRSKGDPHALATKPVRQNYDWYGTTEQTRLLGPRPGASWGSVQSSYQAIRKGDFEESDGLPRLHSQLAQKQQDVGHTRTHQAFRTRLPTYSRNLSYVVQSDLILTKEAPMHNEISFEAIRRKDTFFFGRRFCGAEQRC